jgi:hypothetical protein
LINLVVRFIAESPTYLLERSCVTSLAALSRNA